MSANKNEAQQLREVLFDQMKRLNDPTANLEQELKRATAIAKVGTVIVNSHKQEVDLLKLTAPKRGSGGKTVELKPLKSKKMIGNGK